MAAEAARNPQRPHRVLAVTAVPRSDHQAGLHAAGIPPSRNRCSAHVARRVKRDRDPRRVGVPRPLRVEGARPGSPSVTGAASAFSGIGEIVAAGRVRRSRSRPGQHQPGISKGNTRPTQHVPRGRPTREQHGQNGIPRHTAARPLKCPCKPLTSIYAGAAGWKASKGVRSRLGQAFC